MQPGEIFAILNRHVFGQEKVYLIKNIAESPERFLGVFRSTTPCLKLTQNLLQSREIRYGDALEETITELIADIGYTNLQKTLISSEDRKLACDQYFTNRDRSRYYLVEQKIRDDHDSSKREGQISNFRRKLEVLRDRHGKQLIGIMHFIDPSLHKNKDYYETELGKLSREIDIDLRLCYDGMLFEILGQASVWRELEDALLQWQQTVPTEIDLNLDADPDTTAHETCTAVRPNIWLKLAQNDSLWNSGVIRCIFPKGTGLAEITRHLEQRHVSGKKERKTLEDAVKLLKDRLRANYEIDLPDAHHDRLL